ncbi:hypothetical protein DFJ74DRAFT_704574 [Hyaloraphidium curvatum]|nr:hypothetical protein DFJ74DRAFT_704574 [Hyaloraphidium curvatum]
MPNIENLTPIARHFLRAPSRDPILVAAALGDLESMKAIVELRKLSAEELCGITTYLSDFELDDFRWPSVCDVPQLAADGDHVGILDYWVSKGYPMPFQVQGRINDTTDGHLMTFDDLASALCALTHPIGILSRERLEKCADVLVRHFRVPFLDGPEALGVQRNEMGGTCSLPIVCCHMSDHAYEVLKDRFGHGPIWDERAAFFDKIMEGCAVDVGGPVHAPRRFLRILRDFFPDPEQQQQILREQLPQILEHCRHEGTYRLMLDSGVVNADADLMTRLLAVDPKVI